MRSAGMLLRLPSRESSLSRMTPHIMVLYSTAASLQATMRSSSSVSVSSFLLLYSLLWTTIFWASQSASASQRSVMISFMQSKIDLWYTFCMSNKFCMMFMLL